MARSKQLEVVLWSIAFPGFGQFLNGQFLKGITFLILELLITTHSNLNTIIISSFHGDIKQAINQTNYQWLMFYPCVYLFAIWDAYRDAGGGKETYSFLPFVCSAYFGTVGVIYSSNLWGPIWMSILLIVVGIIIGIVFRRVLKRIGEETSKSG
ncbi:MAG TPA: hypothetical protein VJ824_08930 [Bacillota bacterium]|nr:hypothetical protein [Bacillota bacterium]